MSFIHELLLVHQSSVGSEVGDPQSCSLIKVQSGGQLVYTVIGRHGKLCITSANCGRGEDTIPSLPNTRAHSGGKTTTTTKESVTVLTRLQPLHCTCFIKWSLNV